MRNRYSQRGYLLVEVMVATMIFTVALSAAIGLFSQSLKANNEARQYTLATSLAQKQLEVLKSWTPAQWTALTLPAVIPWQDGTVPSPYTVTTQAVACPEDTVHLVQATVTVTWGTGTSLTMSAYYSNKDLTL